MKSSILVVDDQAAIALSTQKKLRAYGFDVDAAESGEEALTLIEKKNYDIVILDIMMPNMNGIQVLEFITAKHPYSDVMMMTAFEDYSMAKECMEKGAKEYLLKPLDFTELVSRINALLRVRDSEHRFSDLRNFWQSTVLFDVYGSLQSIHFILDHAIESMKSSLPEKDIALLLHALDLNEQVVRTLKESSKINDLAVCDRSHRCVDCALKENVKNNDLAEGFFLLRLADTDLGLLIKQIADRYVPCFLGKSIVFQQENDPKLPLVKCDPERIEQVVNSIFEAGIEDSNHGDILKAVLSKSQVGLHGEPNAYVICSIEYSHRSMTPEDFLKGMTEEDTDWKNITKTITANTLNLTICRRIVEGQGGAFKVETHQDNRIQIKFTLPLV